MRSSKDAEVNQLREQVNRLQVQLNHGHTGFTEFREKKLAEVQTMQIEIQKLKEQVWQACLALSHRICIKCFNRRITNNSFFVSFLLEWELFCGKIVRAVGANHLPQRRVVQLEISVRPDFERKGRTGEQGVASQVGPGTNLERKFGAEKHFRWRPEAAWRCK